MRRALSCDGVNHWVRFPRLPRMRYGRRPHSRSARPPPPRGTTHHNLIYTGYVALPPLREITLFYLSRVRTLRLPINATAISFVVPHSFPTPSVCTSFRIIFVTLLPFSRLCASYTMFVAQSLVLASLAVTVLGGQWHLADSHVGKDFLDAFIHQAIKDPTLGRMYVRLSISVLLR